MKVGVEEEFIVVDPETLWINSGAFRLANDMVYTDKRYIKKCNVELPLNSGSISHILTHVSKGFCIFELKTDPYEDIDHLKEEIMFHRKRLSEKAEDNHLWVLPCGLHPGHRITDFRDNCAAFHVHVDYAKHRFDRLKAFIPFLIAISVNSPFLDGHVQAYSNRMKLSPHVSMVSDQNDLDRNSDIIHNPTLDTVEVKVFDTQITIDESVGLVSIVKAICEDEHFSQMVSQIDGGHRTEAVLKGPQIIDSLIDTDLLLALKEYNDYSSKKLSMVTGAEWQMEIFDSSGLSSVIRSLAFSFIKDERVTQKSSTELDRTNSDYHDLWYFLPYLPFFILEKYNKYIQDIKKSGGIKSIKHHT